MNTYKIEGYIVGENSEDIPNKLNQTITELLDREKEQNQVSSYNFNIYKISSSNINIINSISRFNFLGTSSTKITNLGNEYPTINGQMLFDLKSGDIVLYKNTEYIYSEINGGIWYSYT